MAVDNGPTQTFTFSDVAANGLSAQQVVDQVNSSFPAPKGFIPFVKTVGTSEFFAVRTSSAGDSHYIKIGEGTANGTFGFPSNYQVQGVTDYRQESLVMDPSGLPDPRGIIDEMSVINDSIRVFVDTGSALKEMTRDTTFLRNASSVVVSGSASISFPLTCTGSLVYVDSADKTDTTATKTITFPASRSDALYSTCSFAFSTPTVTLTDTAAPFSSADVGRTLVIANATTSGNSGTFTVLTVTTDGKSITYSNASGGTEAFGATTTWSVRSIYQNIAGLVNNLNAIAGGTKWANASDVLNFTPASGVMWVTTVPAGLQFTASSTYVAGAVIVAVEDGSTGTTTPLVSVSSEDFTAAATAAIVTGSATVTTYTGQGKTLQFSVDGGPMQEITFVDASYSQAQTETLINATMGAGFAEFNGSDKLVLTSSLDGKESEIKIGAGTANTDFGFTDDSTTYGQAHLPLPGDVVYAGGSLLGIIVQVAQGGVSSRFRLDRKVSKTYYAASYYIERVGIPVPLPNGYTGPTPDMYVDAGGNVHIKQEFLRDILGAPISGASGQLVVSYKALRLDVTQRANNPALLTFDSTDTLETVLSPVNAENPLALMLYFALINATSIEVSGIGVDEVSDSEPEGSADGYSRALGFLEAHEIYALAPGTQSPTVHQLCATHVTDMSAPDAKGERIAFICPPMPDEDLPALATSGTDGESSATPNEFETNQPSLSADLLAAGLSPDQTFSVATGLYLSLSADARKFNVASVSGTKLVLRVAFSADQNTDGFYTTDALPGDILQRAFSLYIRGAALVTIDGSPDYAAIAAAYQALGQSYGNRRVFMVAPERVGAIVDGSEQQLPGFYLCAALAGMVGQLPPQQGFTNYPITGFTRPLGSSDMFSRVQMNTGAAGGTFWVVQNTAGAPLMARHQLATDLTSIEARELSITKVVDFVAKMMRGGLRNFIGKFNITQPFLDTLSTVIQGMINYAIEQGVIIGGDLNNIIQDANAPDSVLIDITLDPPYPCNYLRLTLVI